MGAIGLRQPLLSGTRAFNAWLFLALFVNALAFALTRLTHRPEIAYAAAFDVAVTVPALYYLLVVRSGAQRALTLLPLTLVAFLRALYVVPGATALRPAFGAAAELVVLGFVVARVRSGWADGDAREDLVARLRRVGLEMTRSPAIADLIATEAAMAYYALAPRPKVHAPAGLHPFFVHAESGVAASFGCIAALSLVEAIVVHLLVGVTHPRLAWALTVASLYGAVWLVAIGRSFAYRPILVGHDAIEVRSGLLLNARVSRTSLVEAVAIAGAEAGDRKVLPMSAPNVRLVFSTPVSCSGLYGRKRSVTRMALTVDEPGALLKALSAPGVGAYGSENGV